MAESIKVFAPASVGNACVGFDVLGFAVEEPGDEIELRKKETPGIRIKQVTGDDGKLSKDPASNTATIAIQAFIQSFDPSLGLEVTLHKKMPFGSGLGSSAASAVAGAVAANALFDTPFAIEKVFEFAMKGESFASGAYHADNVAPCLYGGLTLVRSINPCDVVKIPVPANLYATLIYPEVEIKTAEARSILPCEIPLKTASKQWGNLASFIAGMMSNNMGLISRSMTDYVAEPYRAKLIPGFDSLKEIALDTGALGYSISGSGPTMFAFCEGRTNAEKCGKALSNYYTKKAIPHQVYISKINHQGTVILD